MPFPKQMFIYEFSRYKNQPIWLAVEYRCELGLAMDVLDVVLVLGASLIGVLLLVVVLIFV